MTPVESAFWSGSRHILHFMGICGAGKTTLSGHLAARCRISGGHAIGTIDWDPHSPDGERLADRAFRRDLDQELIANPADPAVHRRIVEHSLSVINEWRQTDANLVVLDRFVESYDHLPAEAVQEVQAAMAASGFTVINILLVVGGLENDQPLPILPRIMHTRVHRPAEWWATGPATAEEWAEDEARYQAAYRAYCKASPFETMIIDTTMMHWNLYEAMIVREMISPSWVNRLDGWPPPGRGARYGLRRPARYGFNWFGTMPPANGADPAPSVAG